MERTRVIKGRFFERNASEVIFTKFYTRGVGQRTIFMSCPFSVVNKPRSPSSSELSSVLVCAGASLFPLLSSWIGCSRCN